MEGMSLALPVVTLGDDVFGGLDATDRNLGRGSLILRATEGGYGLRFFPE